MLNIFTKCRVTKLISLLNKQKPTYLFAGTHKDTHGHGHEQGHHDHHDHHDHHHEFSRDHIQLRDQKSGYYLNPNQCARRMIRVIAQFDKVLDPEKVTLSTQWHEMGLNQLDTVELLVGIEDEFKIEFPDEIAEKFKDVHDVVQYVSRSFWAE